MTETHRRRGAALAAPIGLVGRAPRASAFRAVLVLVCAMAGSAGANPPSVVDSESIVRSLQAQPPMTRGLVVAPRTAAGSGAPVTAGTAGASPAIGGPAGGTRKVALDIRFANDSDRLTAAAHAQLEQLGVALDSPELAHSRFVIAGHTSATGSAAHNLRLSRARARSVRAYLLEHFQIAPDRIEATGYGSSRPLPDFPPAALQQRRVEISALPRP